MFVNPKARDCGGFETDCKRHATVGLVFTSTTSRVESLPTAHSLAH